MTDRPKNIAASVRQRLLNISRETKEDFQFVLTRYALERLLFRLSRSPHGNRFVLKGAMLFRLWTGSVHRPTKDLDLLGYGENSTDRIADVFRDVCHIAVDDDGLRFDAESIVIAHIKDDDEYEGVRVRFDARLESARIRLQVDIGFGDAITPAAEETEFPTLLDFAAPIVLAYPKETVVAEKYQAMVRLGIANSRMKDFFDVWILARMFDFRGELLARAIAATFERRRTDIPRMVPLALSDAFATDRFKATQWRAFIGKSKLTPSSTDFGEVVHQLNSFLWPPTDALSNGSEFGLDWPASGPWRNIPGS